MNVLLFSLDFLYLYLLAKSSALRLYSHQASTHFCMNILQTTSKKKQKETRNLSNFSPRLILFLTTVFAVFFSFSFPVRYVFKFAGIFSSPFFSLGKYEKWQVLFEYETFVLFAQFTHFAFLFRLFNLSVFASDFSSGSHVFHDESKV